MYMAERMQASDLTHQQRTMLCPEQVLLLQVQKEVEQNGWSVASGGSEQIITLPRK